MVELWNYLGSIMEPNGTIKYKLNININCGTILGHYIVTIININTGQ